MTSSVRERAVGRMLDGRYRLLGHIADGGMASVWEAEDTRLDRRVAVKILHPDLTRDPTFAARFQREARSAARLSHPNVVAVYDQGATQPGPTTAGAVDGGQEGDDSPVGRSSELYLVMELVTGRTLRDIVDDEGSLPVGDALDLMDGVLTALTVAHEAGLVHRDIKPENVIVREDGVVKVADFGLARAVTATTTAASTAGVLLGTVAYIAPEQVERGVADARSDVYSAGLVLFELLTGRKAFDGDSPIHIAYRHVHGAAAAPSSLVSSVPPLVDSLVAQAASRLPDERFDSAGPFLEQLRRTRAELPSGLLQARPTPVRDPDRPLARTAELPDAKDSTAAGRAATTRALPSLPPAGTGAQGQRPRHTQDSTSTLSPGGAAQPPATDDVGAPPQRPTRRRRTGIWLAALLVVLLLGGGGGWYLLAGPGATTTVPTVVGLTAADASASLASAHLGASTTQAYDETVPSGVVLREDPTAGTQAHRSDTVSLTVSKGPERYAAPTLTGTGRDQASAALQAAHLTLGTVTEQFDDTAPAGQILAQDPAAGTSLKPQTAVNLTVSKGRQPIPVTDFTGKSVDQASAALGQAGLKVVTAAAVNSATIPAGSVITQTPANGTLFKGDTVTLTPSKGPVMVAVPDVTLKSTAEATSVLKAAGFQVTVTKLYGGILGVVRFQNPANGTAPQGSTVTISVI